MNQPLMAVQICIDGSQDGDNGKGSGELATLFATPNHPFWVETPLAENEEKARMHWLAAECLEPCMVLQLADGRSAEVRSAALIRRTQHEGILFAGDDRVDVAQMLCLSDGRLEVASDQRVAQLGTLELGEDYLAPVYSFEVEGFHTYYVGEQGVWVHNQGCDVKDTLAAISKKNELESVCFDGDTPVVHHNGYLGKIENVEVGSLVVARCERTGEVAPKRVLRVYENSAKQYAIYCRYGPIARAELGIEGSFIYVTGDHPFWVNGKGWTPVRDLQPGDAFLTLNGDTTTVGKIYTPEESAKSINPAFVAQAAPVYNLEVEDFNTYFVGTGRIWVHNCNIVNIGVNILNPNLDEEPRPR